MSSAVEVPAPEPQEDAVGSKSKRNSIGSSTEGATMRDSKRVRKPNALYTDGYQVETPKKGERPKEKAIPEPTVPEPVVQTSGRSLILKRVKKPAPPETQSAPAATSSPVTPSPAPAPSVQVAPAASPPAGADGEKKRRKDKMLTPEEVKQQRLPKGYALEVVGAESAPSKERLTLMLPAKRERRKSAVLEDYIDPSARRKGRKDKDSSTEDEPDLTHRKKAAKRELKLKKSREIQERLAAVEAKLSSYGTKPVASDSAASDAVSGAAPEATPINGGVATNGASTAMATSAPEHNPEYIPPAAVAAHHAQLREQLHASLNASLNASSSYVSVLVSSSHSVRTEETVLTKRSHKPNSQFAEYETGDAPLAEESLVALSKPSFKIQRPKKHRSADGALPSSRVSPPPVISAPVFPGRAQRTQRRRRQRSESPSESRSETAVLSPELKQCLALLKQLMKHQHAWPFNSPVDPVALNIPDYFDVIKHPMDFGTIRLNLESGQYTSVDQFHDDMQLVFSNCFAYNNSGTDIAVMAEAVKETYETQYKRLKSGDWNPSALEETMHELKAAQDEIRQLNREKKALAMSGGPAKPRGWQKEDNRMMTLDEKRALSAAINALPGEHLGSVVQIISERMPALTRGAQGEEIEVDIDALDAATLRHLERFVKNTQNKKKSSLARSADPTALASSSGAGATTAEDTGTSKRIKDVERRLQELNDKAAALTRIGGFNKKREPLIPEGVAQPVGGKNGNNDDSTSSSSSSSSSDSDSSSSSDNEAEVKPKTEPSTIDAAATASAPAPTILAPVAAAPKEVVLHNTDAWASLDAGGASAPTAAPSTAEQSDGLWDAFKAKEKQNKQREKEREEHEEKLRKEREEREEERKREEERRRKAAEEEEARRVKAASEAEVAAQKQREEQRLAEKLAREAETPKVNLTEQSNVMSLFEAEPSSALKQEPTAPREG